jgi:hypothetical protein
MWKANLNRHFAKISRALKISAFLLLWNILFHSFTLSILLYWSLTSSRVPQLSRMTTLNQFLSENQILFAALSSLSALFFFRDVMFDLWTERRTVMPEFLRAWTRGMGFGISMLAALTLGHQYKFLGFSTQLDLNFLASYAWILRALLIFLFVSSTELLVRVVVKKTMPTGISSFLIQNLTLVLLYWIWFNSKPAELLTLFLLFSIFSTVWASIGFLSALFILVHAICGLNFFENEFAGLIQFKILATNEESFFQNHTLQAVLVILLVLIHYVRMRIRKEPTLA